jgi:cell shape-determining protein MreC
MLDSSDIGWTESQEEGSNRHLKERYEQLQREYATLKLQFDEAVHISGRLEELHTENAKLSLQLRAVQSEKEDYAHRLNL